MAIFSPPDPPAPPPAPPPPPPPPAPAPAQAAPPADAVANEQRRTADAEEAEETRARLTRRRVGRAATIETTPRGLLSEAARVPRRKSLLGE